MCTVTQYRDMGRVLITMNRDESETRDPESPPTLRKSGAVAWLAPTDGTAGGTWIGVNSCGIAAFLLNGYEFSKGLVERGSPSRGSIVPQIMERGDWEEVWEWLLQEFTPEPYQPFRLGICSFRSATLATWTGSGQLTLESVPSGWCMTTSSSWRSGEVAAWRHSAFLAWVDEGASQVSSIPGFHLSRPSGWEEWAPLMRRKESRTRSISQVEIIPSEGKIEMCYWPVTGGGERKEITRLQMPLAHGHR